MKNRRTGHRFVDGIEERWCSQCSEFKILEDFYRCKTTWDGLSCRCKVCNRANVKEWKKANPERAYKQVRRWNKENPEKRSAIMRRWKDANPNRKPGGKEHCLKGGVETRWCGLCRQWKKLEFGKNRLRYDHLTAACNKCTQSRRKIWVRKNTEKVKASTQKWNKANPEKVRAGSRRRQKRRLLTPKGRINKIISIGIYISLRGAKNGCHWEDLVGFTLLQLIRHLKKTLPDGYTWKDYVAGKTDLHLDHKIPIAAFNFNSADDPDFKRCWDLKNLQLLPGTENIQKSDKLFKPFQPSFSFYRVGLWCEADRM